MSSCWPFLQQHNPRESPTYQWPCEGDVPSVSSRSTMKMGAELEPALTPGVPWQFLTPSWNSLRGLCVLAAFQPFFSPAPCLLIQPKLHCAFWNLQLFVLRIRQWDPNSCAPSLSICPLLLPDTCSHFVWYTEFLQVSSWAEQEDTINTGKRK